MPDTQHLYSQSDDAALRLQAIARARKQAVAEMEAIAHRLATECGCDPADTHYLLDHISDGLDDMLADVTNRWEDEKSEADNRISNIEEADLRARAW